MADGEATAGALETGELEFAGWGTAEQVRNLPEPERVTRLDQPARHLLGTWRATAICGNDITSSVLYVSALAAAQAGVLAPLVLVIVAAVLYLYRLIYAEVGSALPLNGGTYTVLLNTTNKRLAAGAACLTLLSYVATAVISANEAMHYLHHLLAGLDITTATIALLAAFALLSIVGISESGSVALGIFLLHMLTLTVLCAAAILAVVKDPALLHMARAMPPPGGFLRALFFGFAAAMLGISGFESSANFIEEQRPGVFPRTLRNMWIAVAVFNPLISLLSLGLLPLAEIRAVPPDLLAIMGTRSAGAWLGWWVSVDAVLVLSGAVLTSYVGVTGLVRRMTLDRCLPQFLLHENRWRQTNHWITICFFLLCTSILLITEGNLARLAGVYTLSFLSVMALFAIGNLLLKRSRARLPRAVRAGRVAVVLGRGGVLVGLVGNVLLDPGNVRIFLIYLGVALGGVGIMLGRVTLLRLALRASAAVVGRALRANEWVRATVARQMDEINALAVVYFSKGDDLDILDRAARYVLENEQTNRMKVVHVYHDEEAVPRDLAQQLKVVDGRYPHLRIDFLLVRGTFGPVVIEQLSRYLRVPKNLMFIGTPGDRFPHRIEDLGGVRVIL